MYTFDECREIINKAIQNLQLRKDPENLYIPVKYILTIGGKKIRPAIALMACNIFSDKIENAINPALAIEVFHNFTLLHDDIMDNSTMRRGKATVHKKWDINTAILSGDAMCIIAYEILLRSKPEVQSKVLPVFTQTALEVCEGQQYDMDFETQNNVSEAQYIEMITLKTAVLLAASLKIGALSGDAGELDAENIYQFGKNIGIAFQLQDDLLDVYGDPSVFGKKNGGDILANKKTFLLIKALELANGSTYKKLNELLNDKDIDEDKKIQEVIAIYDLLKVKETTTRKIIYYFEEAMKNINKLDISSNKLIQIKSLIENLMTRAN